MLQDFCQVISGDHANLELRLKLIHYLLSHGKAGNDYIFTVVQLTKIKYNK